MPALRTLGLRYLGLPDEAAEELFRASSAEAVPQLRSLTLYWADLSPAAARLLAATGWRLEALDLSFNPSLGAAGLAVLLAAPTFSLRRLNLTCCGLDTASLVSLANAPWPLEELDVSWNDFSGAAAGPARERREPALAALSHACLRRLNVSRCKLTAASFKALVEAAWPALTHLSAHGAKVAFDGPGALGAAAYAGLPALEELDLTGVVLGEAGAAVLAGRRWARLRSLNLLAAELGGAGVAALARGAWPALEALDLRGNDLGAPLTLEGARRWAPALLRVIL